MLRLRKAGVSSRMLRGNRARRLQRRVSGTDLLPKRRLRLRITRLAIGGQEISYTATAATYIIRDDESEPKATIFFVAYTKDDVTDTSKRPLSFVYNGGPGSASCFTHMGLGPRRIVLTDDGHGMAAPYAVEDNNDSFLDATDMVFIDAVSTGYSRPANGQNATQFYGIVQDATLFSDFIYQYVTRNSRWASPKYLLGESYGTTRSAQLSNVLLHRHEMYLNGVALISSVAFANWGADDRSKFFLPTQVTSAWYHHLVAPDLQKLTVEQVAQQAREFAHGEYAAALEKGDQISPAEYKKVVTDLSRFTGLSPKYIESKPICGSARSAGSRNCCATSGRPWAGWMRDLPAMDVDAAGERNEYDSSEASYEGAYVRDVPGLRAARAEMGQRHVSTP